MQLAQRQRPRLRVRREKTTGGVKCALPSKDEAFNRNKADIREKAKMCAPNLFASLVDPTPVIASSEAPNTDTSAVDESDAADCIIIDDC